MKFITTLMTKPQFVKILLVLCAAFALSNNCLFAQDKPSQDKSSVEPTEVKTLQIDQAADQTGSAATAARVAGDETRRYRIGAGDELEI